MMRYVSAMLLFLFYHLVAKRRRPDQIIGEPDKPYLLRWWISRHPQPDVIAAATGLRRKYLEWRAKNGGGLYLHLFLQSDEDRALHDHPWPWVSLILDGKYREHRHEDEYEASDWKGSSDVETHLTYDPRGERHYDTLLHVIRVYEQGSLRSGTAEGAHRIELYASPTPNELSDLFPWMTEEEAYNIYKAPAFKPVWSLFAMGPYERTWGFHCPKGWVHWRDFTDPTSGGNKTGRGCGEMS